MQYVQTATTLSQQSHVASQRAFKHAIAGTLHVPTHMLKTTEPPRGALCRALLDLEQFGHADPAAAIDMLVMHHDAVGSFGQPSDTPKHVIACGGAEGEGPTPACAITAWTIRARYLLAESVL